ncbi:Prefoldin [Phytophthora cactorum]|nr:Prefoldin [Phytophthora cactorum]
MTELKEQVEAEMTRYRALQDEVQVLATQRQTYAQQANENDMVKKELDLLDDEAKVYKLVGPVLLKQDVDEAKSNVNKRLEFINNELSKVNSKIEAKEKEAVGIRTNLLLYCYWVDLQHADGDAEARGRGCQGRRAAH